MQSRTRLLQLLTPGEFRTGTALGRELGISRAAVNKHIRILRDNGLPVDCAPRRGYRLAPGVVLLQSDAILPAVSDHTRAHIRDLHVRQSVDSTNGFLLRLPREGNLHGQVCIAEAQPGGRGRRGNRWVAPPYRNLAMSLGWVFDRWPRGITGLGIAVGMALIDALSAFGITGLGIKWPNDLIYDQRKLGGILVDVSGESLGPCFAVIGVGINVDLSGPDAACIGQPWIDLVNGMNIQVDRNRLAAACLDHLVALVSDYARCGFEPHRERWSEVDVLAGRDVSIAIHCSGGMLKGRALGVDHAGALRVRLESGAETVCYQGDVSVRPE